MANIGDAMQLLQSGHGVYGSISVVERLIRTVKNECTRRLLVSYDRAAFHRELSLYVAWFNTDRPHDALEGATPEEMYEDVQPACREPRFEPRKRWPRGSPCARPPADVRGRRGGPLKLNVSFVANRRHLPIVEIRRAA